MQIWSDIEVQKGSIVEYQGHIYEVHKCQYDGFYDGRNHYTLTIEQKPSEDILQ